MWVPRGQITDRRSVMTMRAVRLVLFSALSIAAAVGLLVAVVVLSPGGVIAVLYFGGLGGAAWHTAAESPARTRSRRGWRAGVDRFVARIVERARADRLWRTAALAAALLLSFVGVVVLLGAGAGLGLVVVMLGVVCGLAATSSPSPYNRV